MKAPYYLLLYLFLVPAVFASVDQTETWNWPVVPEIKLPVDASGKPLIISEAELRQILQKARAPFPVISDTRYALIPYAYLSDLLDWYGNVTTLWGATPQEIAQRGMLPARVVGMLRLFTGRAVARANPEISAGIAMGILQVTLKQPWGENKAGITTDFLLVGTDRGWFVVDPATRLIRPLAQDARIWRFNLTRF